MSQIPDQFAEAREHIANGVEAHQDPAAGKAEVEQLLGDLEDGGPVVGAGRKPKAVDGEYQKEAQRDQIEDHRQKVAPRSPLQLGRQPVHDEMLFFAPERGGSEENHPGEAPFHDLIEPAEGELTQAG